MTSCDPRCRRQPLADSVIGGKHAAETGDYGARSITRIDQRRRHHVRLWHSLVADRIVSRTPLTFPVATRASFRGYRFGSVDRDPRLAGGTAAAKRISRSEE